MLYLFTVGAYSNRSDLALLEGDTDPSSHRQEFVELFDVPYGRPTYNTWGPELQEKLKNSRYKLALAGYVGTSAEPDEGFINWLIDKKGFKRVAWCSVHIGDYGEFDPNTVKESDG